VLTIFLSIGAGMYDSARKMLTDADETFTSIVELEYLGDMMGDEVSFYKNMNSDLTNFDFHKLRSHPSVKAVNRENTAWAYIDGDTIKRNNLPLNNYVMLSVSNIMVNENHVYTGIVQEVLFGKKARKGAYINISDVDQQGNPIDFHLDSNHEYLFVGRIANGWNKTYNIFPGMPDTVENIPAIIDLTENPDYFQSEEGKRILRLQEAMTVVDNSLQVTTVSNLEASSPYYFYEILLKDGRIFNSSEYQPDKNEVVLISEAVAKFYQVEVGDKLPLKIHYNKNGLGISDFLADNQYDYEANYEVVGIFVNKEETKFTIYMPEAEWIEQDLHSTIIASYIIENGSGEKFMEDNKDSLLTNMEFTLYDQGYTEAVKPIVALKNNAAIIIALGLLSVSSILILFSYLYVIKQKDTLKAMLSLGTGKRRTMNYILYGSVILVFSASFIGAIISSGFLHNVTESLFESMQDTYGTDLRFSERSIGLQMNYVPQVSVNLLLPVIVIGVILAISLLLLFLFTNSVLLEDKQVFGQKKKKKVKIIVPGVGKARKMLFGRVRPISVKFAFVSLVRSPGRSLIIPIISLILSVFIIFLGLLSGMQQKKLDTVYERIPVTTYITTPRNETRDVGSMDLQYDIYRLIDPEYSYRMDMDYWKWQDEESILNGLYNSEKALEERRNILESSEYFDDMYLYTAVQYEYMGISMTKEGEENKELSRLPDIRVHNNNYGYDWFLAAIKKMPKLAYADDLRYTPDFFKNSDPEVEFLEGYSYDSLRLSENIGIISNTLAATYGVENGDSLRVTAWFQYKEAALCSIIDFKVVGIYDTKWKTDTIYLPWIMSYDHPYCYDFNYTLVGDYIGPMFSMDISELVPRNVRAVTFSMKNTEHLSVFRDYLMEESYSQVGKMGDKRRVIVIQDKSLVETVQNLKSHIRLIDTIKPIMLILFGIIGFAVSYLLIKHRTNEFAIMRSMGARKRQVFFSFFFEQLILFFIGLIPAGVYVVLLPDQVKQYGASLIYFILSYLIGTALALFIMNRAKILDILFTKE
jgi:ABC-type lipoprotein release transport system permease subunit